VPPDQWEEPLDVEAALLARARQATDAAARIVEDSEVLVEVSEKLREGMLVGRCAWCSRYRLAGRWVVVERMPKSAVFTSATHTICDDCLQALRETGMSV
jgi:hypothetical protein